MQINGNSGTTMAASEPPEPPPRNPDKINASLKQISTETKAPKLDANNVSLRTSQKLNNAASVSSPSPDAPKSVVEQENGEEAGEEANNSHGETDTLNGKDDNTVDSFRTTVDKPDLDSFDDLDSPQSSKLKVENQRLSAEISRLKKLLEISPDGAIGGIDLSDNNSFDAHSTDGSSSRMERLEVELRMAREQITHLRSERKKLRADKADLLRHVKQLCSSLHDKEQELRDFIRNYEQRLRDNESTALKMTSDRERERWSLMKHARDEAERSLVLAAQLNARDLQLQRTQEQLQEARRQLSGCMSDQESLISMPPPLTPPSSGLLSHLSSGFSGSAIGSGDSTVRGNSDKDSAAGDLNLSDGPCENGMCLTMDPDNISLVSSQHNMYQYGTPVKERSPTLSPLNSSAFSRSVDTADTSLASRSVETLGASLDGDGSTFLGRRLTGKGTGTLGRSGRGSTWGSISKVFARSRQRARNASQEADTAAVSECGWSPLTEEGYAEKLRLLREASAAPMERWRASQVLAWLEVALGMPQYSVRCSENVKSGKVLLELSDAELEAGMGLSHPMHRKKLRLAIEEQRRPDLVRYPTIGQLGHTWVASEWLPDIGLPQYAEPFLHSLVDARMLDTLSKKELEKMLGVTRKFHQASIVHGIHVLRIIKYDRQELAMRRLQSESLDSDPIVWTNQRFIRWVRSIDLAEYADNLKDSGVHGGLVILEPSFSGETMATALGIPPSKNIIRRHLTAEFDALVLPARYVLFCDVDEPLDGRSGEKKFKATLGQGIRSGGQIIPITGSGGLHHHGTIDRKTSGSLRFATWRGSQSSLSKVFGFTKTRPEKLFNPTSPTNSYSSEDYATVGSFFSPPPTQHPPQPPTTTPPPSLPSHRVSAPPTETAPVGCTLPRQHRRVKSISDIDVIAAAPV